MIGVLYPAPRSVAYSSLFYRMVRNRLLADRVYAGSWFLEEGEIRADTRRGPSSARALFVSLPYEIMYRDYVEALHAARLPLSRGEDDSIIIVGGPAVTANPAPILRFVDAVMVGEIEDVYDTIVGTVLGPGSKDHRLARLAEIPGMLVPGHSDTPVRRHYVKNLDDAILTTDQSIPGDAEPVWGRSYIIETSRGCGRGCRFCMEGYIFRPKRDRSARAIKELVDEAPSQGYAKVSFYSLSFFDNPAADKALELAVEAGLEASVPSLRAETLNERRLRLIGMAGQKTLTIAPETGSCRVCEAINKKIQGSVVEWIAEHAPEYGIKSLKMYLITGFPGESDEDFADTVSLVERVAGVLRRKGLRLKVSLNPFMPKPVTPLQWSPLAPRSDFERRRRLLSKAARRAGNVQLSVYDYRWARIQTVISRGGTELAALLLEWALTGPGAGHFRGAARRAGIEIERYLGEITWEPPWHSLVDHPYASRKLLEREYRMYLMSLGRSDQQR